MKFIVLIILSFLTINGVCQKDIHISDYKEILGDNQIEWLVFKKDSLYYLSSDSNKLANGIFKFTYEENNYIEEHYLNGFFLKEESYYGNGQLRYSFEYKNNKIKDGVYELFYETGEKEKDVTYVEGKLHGSAISYYKSGKLRGVGSYFKGKSHGKVIGLYENGIISVELIKVHGEKKGLSISYYENGQKFFAKHYLSTFKLGNGYEKLWYRNGKLAWEVFYDEKGNRHGVEKAFDEFGILKYQKEWENGKVKSKKQFGSLDNLWFPNIVEGHRIKMQYYFDEDDW